MVNLGKMLKHKRLLIFVAIAAIIALLLVVMMPFRLMPKITFDDGYISLEIEKNKAIASASISLEGTDNEKGSSFQYIYLTDDVDEGDLVICCYAGDDAPSHIYFYYGSGDNEEFNTDATATNSGEAVAVICSLVASKSVGWDGTYPHILVWPPGDIASAVTGYKITGMDSSPFDKSSTATGSGTDANTGTTSLLSQDDEVCIAVTAVEDEVDDSHGTWTTGTGYVSGNEQFDATDGAGDASNMQVHSVAEIVSDGTSQTEQGNDYGHDNNDWAAAIATYKISVGGTPSVAISPESKAFGIISVSSAHWSNGSEPSWPLTDGDAYFTITNDGSIGINISANATNPTGGIGATLVSSSPSADEIRVTVFEEGDGSGDGLVLTTSQQAFISSLGATNDVDMEVKLEIGTSTETPPTQKTFHIYLVATAA